MDLEKDVIAGLFQRFTLELNQEIGLKVQKMIIEELGGLRVTIPTYEDFFRRERNKAIKKDFNGCNIEELHYKYNLSISQIRRVLER